MIITCPNCNKKFKIDNSLIPDEGRDLQCGSCNHVWLYKIEEENSKILKLKEEFDNNDIETKDDKNNEEIIENKNSLTKIETELNNQKKEKALARERLASSAKIKSYIKDGMSQKNAEEKAFLDLLHNSGYPDIKFDKKINFLSPKNFTSSYVITVLSHLL